MMTVPAFGSRTSLHVKILNGVRMKTLNFTAGPPSKAIETFKITEHLGTEPYLLLARIIVSCDSLTGGK